MPKQPGRSTTHRELEVPPTAPSDAVGSCSAAVDPSGTGCVSAVAAGGFLPDGKTLAASFTYAGAPAAPDLRSIYSGTQVVLLRTDGGTLPGGQPWKCVTCGVPAANTGRRHRRLRCRAAVRQRNGDPGGPTSAVADGYSIGQRRLFEPYLVPVGTGDGEGQQLNACANGPCSTLATGPGSSASNPLWGSMANPYWSPDGTEVAYWQTYPGSTDCGPAYGDPTTCPPSTEPGGATPASCSRPSPASSPATWPPSAPSPTACPGALLTSPEAPARPAMPAGTYTVDGKYSGTATVVIKVEAGTTTLGSISVAYHHYSDISGDIINGTESVSVSGGMFGLIT
jgi:hypothetical protein